MADQNEESKLDELETEDKNKAKREREAITRAEGCMTGLMEFRRRYSSVQPLHGVRIAGSLSLDAKTAVLIETLVALGAEVQWYTYSLSNQDEVVSALKQANVTVYEAAVSARRLTLEFPFGKAPNIIFDKNGSLTDALCMTSLRTVIDGIIETTESGIQNLEKRYTLKTLLGPAINAHKLMENAKAMCCNYYRFEKSLVRDIKEYTNKLSASDNVCVVVGYLNWSKSCARALRYAGVTVMITEYNAIYALEAEKDGFKRVTLEQAYKLAKVFVIGTEYPMVDEEGMNKMKADSLVCTISCCYKYELFDFEKSKKFEDYDGYRARFLLKNGENVHILQYTKKCVKRDSPLAMSYSYTLQLLALMELLKMRNKNLIGVQNLPDNIEKNAAQLHLSELPAVQDGDPARSLSNDLTKPIIILYYHFWVTRLPCFSSSMC